MGANPGTTAPPFLHLVAHKAETGHLVVIDPVRTLLAREATLHLQPRPGTDGALALGFIHRCFEADLPLPPDARGTEELRALAAQYPLERVEALSHVPRAALERAFHLLRDGPTSIWQGLGVEHHENGVATIRAITSLMPCWAALTHRSMPRARSLR